MNQQQPLDCRIPIAEPETPNVDASLQRMGAVLSSGSLTNAQEVRRLEEEAAAALGVEHCVALSSCTSGLMLVERCLGISGQVVIPSFTFFATAHGVLWNGLEPRFADIDPGSLQLDPAKVRRVVGPNTGAILGVHLFGCPAPVAELQRIADERGIPLIFDGAHALGATVNGQSVARWGDATVYSLSPTKQLTAGEGGLVATRSAELAADLRRARNYGKGEDYDCDVLGLNARMTEFQAALCREGLLGLTAALERRERLARIYEDALSAIDGVRLQGIPHAAASGRKDFALFIDPHLGMRREDVETALEALGVETRRYFDPPLHRQKLYQQFYRPDEDDLAHTERAASEVVCLPIHRGVSERDARQIASTVVCALKRLEASVA